jgi:hypothetical protein
MSTPTPRRRSRPPGPSRQQIDELDALLERMLALPVNATDEPAAVPAPAPVAVAAAPALPLESPPAEAPAAEHLPLAATLIPPVSPPLPPPSVNPPHLVVPMQSSTAPPAAAALPRRLTPPNYRRVARVPLSLRPLVWLNRGFDRWTMRVGTPGRWLRHSSGRALLGWTGLLLLAAALGIVAFDWIGWPW